MVRNAPHRKELDEAASSTGQENDVKDNTPMAVPDILGYPHLDLDEKLRDIILSPFRITSDGTRMVDNKNDTTIVDTQIAQIKQAFADAGYISPATNKRHRNVQTELLNKLSEYIDRLETHLIAPAYYGADGILRMTGKEWYDRFKELIVLEPWEEQEDIEELARRAAGLTNE